MNLVQLNLDRPPSLIPMLGDTSIKITAVTPSLPGPASPLPGGHGGPGIRPQRKAESPR